MIHTRADVLAAAAFPTSDPETILAELDLYGVEPLGPKKECVQLAIIELGGGSRNKLLLYVQATKNDYRGILAWKQLGTLGEADGVKLQNKPRSLIEKWGNKGFAKDR